MKKTEAFFEMHRDIEVLRRRAIAEYWNDNQTDDVIAQALASGYDREARTMFPADRHAPYGAVQVSGIRGSGQAGPPGDSEPGRQPGQQA